MGKVLKSYGFCFEQEGDVWMTGRVYEHWLFGTQIENARYFLRLP